jgi:hypothetical protein
MKNLTPAQETAIREIREHEAKGLLWYPGGRQKATAIALERRGILRRLNSGMGRGIVVPPYTIA